MAPPKDKLKGEIARDRLLFVLCIYAERSVELPTWKTLARMIGWSQSAAVSRHLQILVGEGKLTCVRDRGFIYIKFPDGSSTLPRSFLPQTKGKTPPCVR